MVNWNPLGTIWHPFEGAGSCFLFHGFCWLVHTWWFRVEVLINPRLKECLGRLKLLQDQVRPFTKNESLFTGNHQMFPFWNTPRDPSFKRFRWWFRTFNRVSSGESQPLVFESYPRHPDQIGAILIEMSNMSRRLISSNKSEPATVHSWYKMSGNLR